MSSSCPPQKNPLLLLIAFSLYNQFQSLNPKGSHVCLERGHVRYQCTHVRLRYIYIYIYTYNIYNCVFSLQICLERGLVPVLDTAYQGFASGDPEADAYPLFLPFNRMCSFPFSFKKMRTCLSFSLIDDLKKHPHSRIHLFKKKDAFFRSFYLKTAVQPPLFFV